MNSDNKKETIPAAAGSAGESSQPLSKRPVPDLQQSLQQLRAEAEARLAGAPPKDSPAHPLNKLVYELQVHQIELEMQNEQLRQAQTALEKSRDRFVDLFEFAPVGYLTISNEGLITEINLKATAMLGLARNKLIHRRFAQFVTAQDEGRWHLELMHMKQTTGGDEQDIDLCLKRNDESTFHVQLNCLRLDTLDAPDMLRLALTDISKIKAAEDDLRIAATAFESQEGMLITDANAVILRVNRAFTNITGYAEEEVIGKNPRILQSGRQKEDFYVAMWDSINNTGAWEGEIWNRRKNGEVYPEHLAITAVKNADGIVTNYVASIIDITLRKASADEIERLAFYDPLTNLPNRRLLQDRLKQAMASSARNGKEGALLFIDLDNFKTLNDTLGHDIGDLLLQQVARRLEYCVREGDTVARLGGDEYVLMLEDLSEQAIEAAAQAETVGNKILATLNQPYQLGPHECRSTPSIGATLFSEHPQAMEELLKQADLAMYQAKKAGRNTLRFFDPQMQASITARVAMEADLRLALEKNQFELYYQLQATHDHKIVSAEVLLRWQHPELGLVSPVKFIPLAEETGLILPIGQWVLETACSQLMKWKDDPFTRHLQLAVNVSARQFYQTDFVGQVRAVLDSTGIDPEKLKLELTESLVLDDIDGTILKMNALRAIGVSFSMDDFGTGFSSLSYLTQLPLSQLKIDQSFVRNIGINPLDSVIVQTIIGMANNLEMAVIAEGVETEEQRAFLELNGCPQCQGYLFSKPVPLAEFEALLKRA